METEEPLDPTAAVLGQCQAWLSEARELRAVPNPSVAATLDPLHQALVTARGNQDRLEEILLRAIALKAATAVRAKELEEAAEDAWEDQANKDRRTMRRDFEGAKERYAYWSIAIREQRGRARLARKAADIADSTETSISKLYYGLDKARLDLHKRMSAVLSWQSNLESQ